MKLLENFNMAPIVAICCGVCVVIILILVNIFIFLKRKKPKLRINQEFMQKLIEALGTKSNILAAKTMNGRVIIDVEDVELVSFDSLKELSTKGVFVTNQTIKMLFPYDSNTISKEIQNLLHTK